MSRSACLATPCSTMARWRSGRIIRSRLAGISPNAVAASCSMPMTRPIAVISCRGRKRHSPSTISRRYSAALPVTAAQPTPGDAQGAQGRPQCADRLQCRAVAPGHRHARVPHPAAGVVRARSAVPRLAGGHDPAQANRRNSADLARPRCRRAHQGHLRGPAERDRGADVIRHGSRTRSARRRSRPWSRDDLGAATSQHHAFRCPGRFSSCGIPSGNRGWRGSADRSGAGMRRRRRKRGGSVFGAGNVRPRDARGLRRRRLTRCRRRAEAGCAEHDGRAPRPLPAAARCEGAGAVRCGDPGSAPRGCG